MSSPFDFLNPANWIAPLMAGAAEVLTGHLPGTNDVMANRIRAATSAVTNGSVREAGTAANFNNASGPTNPNNIGLQGASEAANTSIYGPAAPVVDPSVQTQQVFGSNDLDYNVGMIGTSYLGTRFQKLTHQHSDVPNSITGNDLPNTFISDGQMKGMLCSYIAYDSTNMHNVIPANSSNGGQTEQNRYGFQFHYNPKEIDISYTGNPDVALGFEASGSDPFKPAGSAITQSSINFQIIINRRDDFKYYDPATKQLAAGVSPSIYRGRPPTASDQKRIYDYGTMYDIEYLLAVCLGYKMLTSHRGMTADIGYVSGQIVEVLLGNGLKYLGMVTSVTVAHTIFNQRMVPTHSNLNITLSIVPDFPGV